MITIKHQAGAEKYTVGVLAKLSNPAFIEASRQVSFFDPDFTDPDSITGFDILRPLIEGTQHKVRIGFYTQSWWAYRGLQLKGIYVNAHVPSSGRDVFLNTRRLHSRPLVGEDSWEETIFHELVHISDDLNLNAVYWHGDNNLSGKDNTAPVAFARWAANWKPTESLAHLNVLGMSPEKQRAIAGQMRSFI
jgi:hypothetical protein